MSALRRSISNYLINCLARNTRSYSASANANPVLYSFCTSSCSWRVRIALGLKNIPYNTKPISLTSSDAVNCYSNEYQALNPMQQVPALEIDGHTLSDSVAIMHYLEESRPQNPLLPQDPHKRAKVRQIVQIICSGIQPLQNTAVMAHVGKEKNLEWSQHWISRGFEGLEKVLSASSGKYCVGDEISMADCCLVPQVFNARRYRVNLDPYPTILRLDNELRKHPIISSCHPSTQPDFPQKMANK